MGREFCFRNNVMDYDEEETRYEKLRNTFGYARTVCEERGLLDDVGEYLLKEGQEVVLGRGVGVLMGRVEGGGEISCGGAGLVV